MAGLHADRGDTSHKLHCGTVPTVGLRVFTNDWKWATITKLDLPNMAEDSCGWYCKAWATVTDDEGRTSLANCDRMSTRKP